MASGQTLMDNALAVGFTPKQAYQLAQRLHVDLGSTVTIAGMSVREAQARWGSPRASSAQIKAGDAAASDAVAAASAPIVNSPCLSLDGDGGHATSRFCDVQRKVQANGTDWYLGDEGSGTARDTNNKLKQFRGNTAYGSNNSIVQWRPTGRVDLGSCTTKTFTIDFNGYAVTSSVQSCPNHLDPYLGDLHFGINWTGCNHNYDGISPVDIDHSPPSASAAITVDVKIAWDGIFNQC
jgi:hypothetical protein